MTKLDQEIEKCRNRIERILAKMRKTDDPVEKKELYHLFRSYSEELFLLHEYNEPIEHEIALNV